MFLKPVCDKEVGRLRNKQSFRKISSFHICLLQTPGALILNRLQEAKTIEKSWLLITNSKFNAMCCSAAAVLHPNLAEKDGQNFRRAYVGTTERN